MKPIYERIKEAEALFMERTGKDPTAIYLGEEEIPELQKWVYGQELFMMTHEPKLGGVRIFEVKAKSHSQATLRA